MTQNDQAAMNEQLTELRLNGLSIDGDNRYKQDLIDALIGAMMFGAQGANPPPAGHWLEQFYVIAREEREALARVEAERDTAIVQMQNIRKQRDAINKKLGDAEFELCIAEQQLAEAVGLLRDAASFNWSPSVSERRVRVRDEVAAFLARHAEAEQQEAREETLDDILNSPCAPCEEEAQGAQAGEFQREDRYIVIKRKDLEAAPFGDRVEFQDALDVLVGHLPERKFLVIESDWPEYEPTWAAIQARVEARAALATQPAVSVSAEAMSFEYAHISGERRTVSITREDVIEGMEDALYEKLSDQICRCEPIGETNVVECNCQDYVEEFTLVVAKPAVRGAEHE